jgi:ABC-type antimicrobial peptide transport system permease subunit
MLLVGPIDHLLQQKEPNVLFARPASMASILDSRLSDFRIVILSLTLFAAVALLLTAIGLYGVLAYDVSQRANEFGIRQAMGATSADVLKLVFQKGLVLAGIGTLAGLVTAYPGTLLIRQLLYETQPIDTASYLGATGFLALVAVTACTLPGWRATRVNLADVLRRE